MSQGLRNAPRWLLATALSLRHVLIRQTWRHLSAGPCSSALEAAASFALGPSCDSLSSVLISNSARMPAVKQNTSHMPTVMGRTGERTREVGRKMPGPASCTAQSSLLTGKALKLCTTFLTDRLNQSEHRGLLDNASLAQCCSRFRQSKTF